ncbi:MAG: hypothetical protein ACKPKO_28865, partial [Candidatus Fonsibacter sp.]
VTLVESQRVALGALETPTALWREGRCVVCSADQLGLGLSIGNRNAFGNASRKPQPKFEHMRN